MLNGLKLSTDALELIDAKEYDKAMSLLKQSEIECGKLINSVSDREKIRLALEKCTKNNPDVMYIKAALFDNDFQGAILFLKRCIRMHPRDADFHRLLSCMYGFAQNFEETLREINQAIELDSTNTSWLYLKATCMRLTLNLKGNDEYKTIKCYQKYLEMNPPDDKKVPEAYYSIAYLYLLKNDIENTKLFWGKAIESEKNRLECFAAVKIDWPPRSFVEIYLRANSYLCENCLKQNPNFKCAACLKVAYCDKNCQQANWKSHKQLCKKKQNQN
jgi:tetratricopeptide (TPR) repeat protein